MTKKAKRGSESRGYMRKEKEESRDGRRSEPIRSFVVKDEVFEQKLLYFCFCEFL